MDPGPPAINLGGPAKIALQAIGKRILTVYGGEDYFKDYLNRNPGQPYTGFIGIEGAAYNASIDDEDHEHELGRNCGVRYVPFQVEFTQNQKLMYTIAVVEMKNMDTYRAEVSNSHMDDTAPLNSATFIRFTVDNRTPGQQTYDFSLFELEPRISLTSDGKGSFVALVANASAGYETLDFSNNLYNQTNTKITEIDGFFFHAKIGIEIAKKLSSTIQVDAKYQFVWHTLGVEDTGFTDNTGQVWYRDNTSYNTTGSQYDVELSKQFRIHHYPRKISVFYQGNTINHNFIQTEYYNNYAVPTPLPKSRLGLRFTF
jgi:hypothetical protein